MENYEQIRKLKTQIFDFSKDIIEITNAIDDIYLASINNILLWPIAFIIFILEFLLVKPAIFFIKKEIRKLQEELNKYEEKL